MASNGQGDVWQAPDKVKPGRGQPKSADMIRICHPSSRYPNGYVRFYNRGGQPMKADGRPGRDKHAETHFEIRPDGTYSVPKGWNP